MSDLISILLDTSSYICAHISTSCSPTDSTAHEKVDRKRFLHKTQFMSDSALHSYDMLRKC